MKNLKLLLISTLSVVSISCSTLPLKAEIKDNHFRFENFKRDNSSKLEYVHLMCFHKKPISWVEPKQYLSGEHDLWVKASISERDIPNSTKEAFVNFKVKLESNKSYMLNRKIVDDKISLWIQEVDTGIGVSDVLISDLKNPLIIDDSLRKRQCKSGSV
ncbi:hypothetical protein ACPUVO_15680 [Pseudocolwellia sp. HL-MZ19]|uniref:hypothetical protein n=1 Tax=unclassified Pseudocolwellia TaxID=2848178 RepID=UPI003CE8978B